MDKLSRFYDLCIYTVKHLHTDITWQNKEIYIIVIEYVTNFMSQWATSWMPQSQNILLCILESENAT